MIELKVDNQIINYVKIADEDYISLRICLNQKMENFLYQIG